ncbi:serine/threonine protein kinase [Brasilonema sp. CT11]|nr:serine/threonine protein kinase [Brasilonema sp. CT11]
MPWTLGQRLQGGKYVIEEVLGQGGFGITYKALDIELNQTVVIKTPNEYLSRDPEYDKYIDRFKREGQILARLSENSHPHIVGVIDLFNEGAIHCLVMDFVLGENLFEAVRRRGALPEAEIVPCIRQIGEALMIVHEAGLVHRDAHPGNIMLRNNRKAVLIDFGIAKEVLPSTLSSTSIAGNDGFAPYEQMSSGSREPTVDVYCLAATLYYTVTGQRPTTSLARKLNNTSLTPPKRIFPGISDKLNKAILKGMALEAKDRPQSMQAWLKMLEAPKVTKPATKSPRIIPWGWLVGVPQSMRAWLKMLEAPKVTPPRIIPWDLLVAVLLSYPLIGYFLGASNARYIVWAVAVAGAVAGAVAEPVAEPQALAVAEPVPFAVALALAVALGLALAVAGAVAGAVAVAVAVALGLALAGDKLRESFSKFHTFLILASTSSLGLGLGWLGHKIFNTGS